MTSSCLDHYPQRAQWGAIKRQPSPLKHVGALYLYFLNLHAQVCGRKLQNKQTNKKLLWLYDGFPKISFCCVALNLHLFILCRALSPQANIIKNIYMRSSNCWHWVKNPISFDTEIRLRGLSDHCKLGIIILHSINSLSNTFCQNMHFCEMLRIKAIVCRNGSVAAESHQKEQGGETKGKVCVSVCVCGRPGDCRSARLT